MRRRRAEGGIDEVRRVVILNPLPRALRHYLEALRLLLERGANGPVAVECDLELGSSGRLGRVAKLTSAVLRMAPVLATRRSAVVIWPIFGLLELALWRLVGGGERYIVIHDPVPLRRQFGYTGIARRLGAWGSRGRRIHVVAHTNLAASALRDAGMRVDLVLPHPVTEGPPVERGREVRVLVAGQFKDARNLRLLEDIAHHAPVSWQLRIVGRGWPEVSGWSVDSRFVSEDELDSQIGLASAVLIPYRYYFQSGIATRAFELATPVVGERHEYLESLYGESWPGLVEGDDAVDWVTAIEKTSSSGVVIDVTTAIDSARVAWQQAVYDTDRDVRAEMGVER